MASPSQQLTVVVPVFNGERHLRECLDSLLAQSRRPDRIVCIDDRSTDGSAGIVSEYLERGVELVRNEERVGLPANWNRAAAIVRTPLFVIAHQDDTYERSYALTLTELLESHPRAFVAHCRATYMDARSRPSPHPAAVYKDRFWSDVEPQERDPADELRVLARGDYIICPSVMYRTSHFRLLGDFDERYAFVPDWEYWIRGLAAGHTIVGTSQRLMRYRYHAASATREHEKTLRRFEEELTLTQRISDLLPDNRSPYVAVRNTLLSEFTFRLAAGDRAGALALLDFGRRRIPRFRSSAHGAVMAAALPGGRIAGGLLAIAQRMYVRFAGRQI